MTDRVALLTGIIHFAEEIVWLEARAKARDVDNPTEAARCRDRARSFEAVRDAMVETLEQLDAGKLK